MNAISKITGVITFPARTTLGAASAGARTTARVLGWAAERALRPSQDRGTSQWPSDPVTVPTVPGRPDAEQAREPDLDPMAATRTPPKKAPARKAPAKKVPASQVPLKSAPTPSLPAAVRSVETDDAPEPAPATTVPVAKKAPARKATAKKAASKKAAVLAPALGLTEAEAIEVADRNGTPGVDKS